MPCIASFSLRQYTLYCLSSTASIFLGKRRATTFPTPVSLGRSRVPQPRTACFTGKSDLMSTADLDDELNKAMDALSTLITRKQRGDGRTYATAYDYMQVYLERLGLDKRLDDLHVVHVAGTKGKGSTCAMVDSILRCCGYKTGLFTSPHLWDVRERIQLDGHPVRREIFLEEFWKCFQRLEDTADEMVGKAAYFRFLTLLGLQIFLREKVDTAVLEVGLGGRLDATNVVQEPYVCGISPLGFDHMEILGHTLPEIAAEKAGIFKKGAPAFTVPQPADAMQVLQDKARAVGTSLSVVPGLDEYLGGANVDLGLAGQHQRINAALAVSLAAAWEARRAQMAGVLQRQGGGDASHANRAALHRAQMVAELRLPQAYRDGLRSCYWPGRAQIVELGISHGKESSLECHANGAEGPARLTFYLDGAHTEESMATCATWFADTVQPLESQASQSTQSTHSSISSLETQRVLLFNCMQERDPQRLLHPLTGVLRERGVAVQHALFVPPDSSYSSLGPRTGAPDLSWQQATQRVWECELASGMTKVQSSACSVLPHIEGVNMEQAGTSAVAPSISSALEWLSGCVSEKPNLRLQVLVTGSLYLVGDVLKHLKKFI